NVIQTDDLVSIDFSLGLGLRIRRDSGDVISEVYDSIRDSGGGRLRRPVRAYFVDQNGARYESGTHERRVVVEEAGPVSAVVRISGWYTGPDGDHVSQYIVRLYVHANSPRIKLVHTFVNTAHCDDKQYKEIALSVPWA